MLENDYQMCTMNLLMFEDQPKFIGLLHKHAISFDFSKDIIHLQGEVPKLTILLIEIPYFHGVVVGY